MNLVKLIMIETGTYDNMFLRPYEIVDSHRHLATIQEVTRGGRNISAEALSGCAGQVLRPTVTPIARAEIPNGWGTRRFRFLMQIEDTDLMGNVTEQYLTGYTDYDGASFHSGSVDPNLRMYVTGTIRMKSIKVMTPYGTQMQTSLANAAQVVTGRSQFSNNYMTQAMAMQRPVDVFTALQTQEFRRFGHNDVFDPRPSFIHENIKLSQWNNNSAPNYLSKVLKAGTMSMTSADYSESASEIWGRAEGLVRESAYSQDPALFHLYRTTSFQEGDSFTYGELAGLFPNLDAVTYLIPTKTMQRTSAASGIFQAPHDEPYESGSYNGWQGQDMTTLWATVLSHAVPALMMETMVSSASFTMHNYTMNGDIDIRWAAVQPFARNLDNATLQDLVNALETKLRVQVARDLAPDRHINFNIMGTFDIMGESKMMISIGDQPPVPYATPTFADSLFAPVITTGQEGLRAIADQLEFFTENLAQADQHPGAFHASANSL